MGGMRGGHGMRMATPMGGLWARCGSQWPPRNADCRGGVFAVFAKISPPTCPPYARTLSDFSPCPIPYMVFGII